MLGFFVIISMLHRHEVIKKEIKIFDLYRISRFMHLTYLLSTYCVQGEVISEQ